MKKCILCGKPLNGEKSKEHIIPESLGNSSLIMWDIHQECNKKLGSRVDNLLTESPPIELIRRHFEYKGKGGGYPHRIKEGTLNGESYPLDKNMKPRPVPLEYEGNTIHFRGFTESEIKENIKKHLKRQYKKTDSEIESILDKMPKAKTTPLIGDFTYNFDFDVESVFPAIIKIAVEYSYYVLGDTYLDDPHAKNLLYYLYCKSFSQEYAGSNPTEKFIKSECIEKPEERKPLNPSTIKPFHVIELERCGDALIVNIMLFMHRIFSFKVIVSLEANLYPDSFVRHIICRNDVRETIIGHESPGIVIL